MFPKKRKQRSKRVLAALLAAILFIQQADLITLATEISEAANSTEAAEQADRVEAAEAPDSSGGEQKAAESSDTDKEGDVEVSISNEDTDTSDSAVSESRESVVEIVDSEESEEESEGKTEDAADGQKDEEGAAQEAVSSNENTSDPEAPASEGENISEDQTGSGEDNVAGGEIVSGSESGSDEEGSAAEGNAETDDAETGDKNSEESGEAAESGETTDPQEGESGSVIEVVDDGGEDSGEETDAVEQGTEGESKEDDGEEVTNAEETPGEVTPGEESSVEEMTETPAPTEAPAEETTEPAAPAEEEPTTEETLPAETTAETEAADDGTGAGGSGGGAGGAGGAAVLPAETVPETIPETTAAIAKIGDEIVTITFKYGVMTDGEEDEAGGTVSRKSEKIKRHLGEAEEEEDADEEEEDTEDEILGAVAEANEGYVFTGWTLKVVDEDLDEEDEERITYELVTEEEELIPEVDMEETATYEFFANFEKEEELIEVEPIVITIRYSVRTDGEENEEGGTISLEEEVIELPGLEAEDHEEAVNEAEIQGAFAEANEGYLFKGWSLKDGEIITEDEELIPEVDMDATAVYEYVANFEKEEIVTPMPAQFFTDYANGVRINVTAPEGAFPEGTKMKVKPVYDEDTLDQIAEGMDLGENEEVKSVQAVDISFYYEEDEIEPLIPIAVELKTNKITDDSKVVHLDDAGDVTDMEAEVDTAARVNNATFESDLFSIYAIVETGEREVDTIVTVNYLVSPEGSGTVSPASEEVTVPADSANVYGTGSTATANDGYVFVNWTDADGNVVGTEPHLADPNLIPIVTGTSGDTTFTANFEAAYEVRFRNRDGEVIQTVYVAPETAIGTLPETIARDGYDAYWATGEEQAGGQSTVWVPIQRIDQDFVPEEDTDIVPDYDSIEYTINFYDSAEASAAIVATKKVDADVSYCLNDIPDVPDKEKYKGKWVYAVDAETTGDFGNTVAVNEVADQTERTLRVWPEYTKSILTVNYYTGEEEEGKTYQTDEYSMNAQLELPEPPVVEGKEFQGWYDGDTQYVGGEAVTKDLELKARFTDMYYVRFVIKNDQGEISEQLSQYFRTGGQAIGTMPQDPFVSGKIFEGWFDDTTGEAVTAETIVNGNIVAVAVFSTIDIYTIETHYYYLNQNDQPVEFNVDRIQVEGHNLPYEIIAPETTQTDPNEVPGAPIYYPETPRVEVTAASFEEGSHELTISIRYVPYTAIYDYVYLLKDLTGGGYTEIDRVENIEGVLNSYVTPTVKSFDYAVLERAQGAVIETDGLNGNPKQALNVYYTRKSFQLIYETNGGSYVGGATVPYQTDQAVSTTIPTRTGYTFAGWYLDENCTQPAPATITVTDNTTLYAKWNGATVDYTIIYMKEEYNNSSKQFEWVYENSYTASGTVGDTVYAATARKLPNTPTAYELNDTMNGTSTSAGTGEDTSAVIKADGSAVLKVYYSLIRYKFVFNINNNNGRIKIGGQTYSNSQYVINDVVLGKDLSTVWPASSDEIYDTRNNHNKQYFTGWYDGYHGWGQITKLGAVDAEYFEGANGDHQVTWTASWSGSTRDRDAFYWLQKADGTWAIDHDYDQIGLNTQGLDPKEINGYTKHNGDATRPDNTYPESGNKITSVTQSTYGGYVQDDNRSGGSNYTYYEYEGHLYRERDDSWWGNIDTGKTRYNVTFKYTYNFYYDRASYGITYYYMNKEAQRIQLSKKEDILFEADISSSTYNYTPSRPDELDSDYSFVGWYADASFSQKYTFTTMPGNNLELYAKWQARSFTVSFVDGDDPSTQLAESQSVEKFKRVTPLGSSPTKTGYNFDGWYTTADGDTLFDWTTQITEDTTVYAHWTRKALSYTVHYVTEVEGGGFEPVAEDKVENNPNFRIGQVITEQAIAVAGYRPDESSKQLTLGENDSENVITFVYTHKPETTSYTVRYILDPEEYPGNIQVHAPKTVNNVPGDTASVIEIAEAVDYDALLAAHPEFEDMEFFPDAAEKTLVLAADPTNNVLTFIYSSFKQATVIVNFVDIDGDPIATQDKQTLKVGKNYTLSRTPIAGWELVKVVEGTSYGGQAAGDEYKITQAVTENGLTFTLFYRKKVTITVKPRNKQYDGTPLKLPAALNDQVDVEGLLSGDSLTSIEYTYANTDVEGGRLNAGIATVTPKNAVFSGHTNPNYYSVRYISGTLEVRKINVTVRIEPDRWVGAKYTGEEYKAGFTNGDKTRIEDYVLISNAQYRETYKDQIWAAIIGLDNVISDPDSPGRHYYVEKQSDAGDYTYDLDLTVADLPQDPNYSVSLYVRSGRLQILPVNISVSTGSATKPYDGTPLTKAEASITGLKASDAEVVTIAATGSRTEVGSATNTYEINWNGVKSTNYRITNEDLGTLIVTESILRVTVKDATKTYNGEAQSGYSAPAETVTGTGSEIDTDEYTITGLLAGHKLTVNSYTAASGTNAATYTNGVFNASAVKVVDADGVDVTSSYDVSVTAGKLTIEKRNVTLTSATDSKTYDGTPLTNHNVTVTGEGFVSGEGATYNVTGTITDPGSESNAFTYTLNEGTLADNYNITTTPGTLTVTKVTTPIVITAASDSKKYDGSPLTNSGFTYTEGVLASGDVLTATVEGTITNFGTADNVVTSYKVMRGQTDVTANYTFGDSVNGTLEITKRNVTLTSATDSKTYDGTPLTNHNVTVTGDGFVEDEGATYNVTGTITDPGSESNAFTYTLNEGTLADNYNITATPGTLTVTKIATQIVITAASDSKVYDGSALTNDGYTYTQNVLVSGDVLTATVEGTITNVGSEDNVVTSYKVMRGNTDVTGNYTFGESVKGTLTVTKRPVTFTAKSETKTYTGSTITISTVEESSGADEGLVSGQTHNVEFSASGVEVGQYTGTITAKDDVVIKSGNTDVTANYDITVVNGKLTITQTTATFTISLDNDEYTYDGQPHYNAKTATSTAASGVTAYSYSFDQNGTYVDDLSGLTKVSAGTYTIYVKGSNPNYSNSATATATLKINKAPLTITADSTSKEYDGQPLTDDGWQDTAPVGLQGSDQVTSVTVSGTITNVGTENNVPSGAVVKNGETDVTSNYEIEYVNGTLEITASTKELKVVSKDYTWTYDGNTHTKYEYTITYGEDETYTVEIAEGETSVSKTLDTGDVVIITPANSAKITHVAESDVANAFTFEVTNSSQYATKTKTEGVLKVTPATLTITTQTASKPYDGNALTAPGNVSGFKNGESANFTVTGTITNVGGPVDNTYTIVFKGEEGATEAATAVRSDYTISDTVGTLTITENETEVKIVSATYSWEYDGTAHTKQEYTVTFGEESYTVTVAEGAETAVATLSTGDKVTITPAASAAITHVAETTVTNDYTYVVDHADQYKTITKETGKLSVTPATLTITTQTASKPYDGTALTAPGNVSGFKNGESADFTVTGTITNVGGPVDNTYTIVFKDEEGATEAATAVRSDYTISDTVGTLTITENETEVKIVSATYSWEYDGTAHTKQEYTVTFGEESYTVTVAEGAETAVATLSTGDKVTITPAASATITHVAETTVTNDYTYVVDHADQYKTITKETGKLSVTPATLTITTQTASKPYDGNALTAPGNVSGFKNGESADFTVTGTITNVGGPVDNTYTIVFKGEEGATEAATAVRSDYTISDTVGTLTITANTTALVITSSTKNWTYDGNLHTDEVYTVTYDGAEVEADVSGKVFTLPTGDTVTITATAEGVKYYNAAYSENNTYTYVLTNASNYSSVTKNTGTLKIDKAPLTITADSASKEYDGQPLTDDGWQDTAPVGLQGSDQVTSVTVSGSITEVGTEDNVASGAVVKNGEIDVTNNYEIEYVKGTLEVTASTKELKVVSKDYTWTYDGNTHTKYEYTITYGDGETYTATLVEGETSVSKTLSTGDVVTITPANSAKITHVAENDVANAFSFEVTNSSQYATKTKTEGVLKVTPATLTITTEGGEKEYDGTALTAEGSISGFVTPTGGAQETATFTVTGSQTEVGKSDNTYTLVWDGTATESDYTLAKTIGKLIVTASTEELKVVSADGEWTYDGDAHTKREYTVTFGDESHTVTVAAGAEHGTVTLATGDVVTITPAATATITHVAESDVTNAFTYTVANSDFYATQEKEEGKLTVTPATLTIVTEGGEKEYDGQPLTAAGSISGFVTPTGGSQETATFTVTGSQTEVGQSDNTYTLAWNGTATESDYTLDKTIGKLKVTQSTKALKVVSANGEWTYDGNAHTNKTYTVTFGDQTITGTEGQTEFALSTGDVVTITPAATATITHVAEGEVTNAFSYSVTNSSQYATISKEEGKLTITPATLTITTGTASREYNGQPLTAAGSISGFVTPTGGEQETATFTVTGTITEVGGPIENSYTLVWNGTATESDYTLDENLGTLEITASTKELKVESSTKSWTYDGDAHTDYNYTVTYDGIGYYLILTDGKRTGTMTLATGDTVTITADEEATITHVAETTVSNAFSYEVTHSDQYSNQVKEEGELKVTPATLTIVTESAEKAYDGTALTAAGSIEGFVTLTDGTQETATFTVTGSQITIGESSNTYTIDWDGTAAETDYTLSEDLGTLKVTANTTELKVVSKDGDWTYDGNAHTKHEYLVTFGDESYTVMIMEDATIGIATLSTGDKVTITPAASATITHVAESDVTNAFSYSVEHSNQYSNQAKEEGTLTIAPATLTIVTEGAEKEYDGTALTAAGSIDGFVTPTGGEQETASFAVTGSQLKIGESDNTYTLAWDGTATESDYTLAETIGKLKVTASTKELKVVSADGEWTYDGDAHTNKTYTVSFGDEKLEGVEGQVEFTLSTGDVVTITPAATATITHVAEGDVTNAFSYTVENSDQYDDQSKEEGVLKVTPATLTIVTQDGRKEYDSEPLTAAGSIDGFVTPDGGEEETATFTVTGSQTNVGESANTYTLEWDGTATESDYTLAETIGTLEVYKAAPGGMGLDVEDYSAPYDAAAHTVSVSLSVTEGTTLYFSTDGETWKTDAPTWTDVTEAQTVYVKAENDNYETAEFEGTVTITALAITVNDTMFAAYDGDEKVLTIAADKATGVLSGETLTLTGATISGTAPGTYEDVADYSWKVVKADGTTDSTGNYTIEVTGTLEITANPNPVAIESSTKSWTYDGDTHTDEVYTVTYGGEEVAADEGSDGKVFTLPTRDTITITATAEGVKDYNENYSENNTYTYVFTNEGNYSSVTVNTGTLSINRATLKITADSASKEYDGTPLTDDGWQDTDPVGLQGEDEVTSVTVNGTITEVGTEDNVPSGAVVMNGETDVTDNYDIEYVNGELEVTANTTALKIKSKDYTWTYDGDTHTYYEYVVEYGDDIQTVKVEEGAATATATLRTGDVVTITPANSAKITHVAETAVDNAFSYTLENSDFYSSQDKTEGKLTIAPATLTVVTGSGEKEYDGTALTVEGSIDGFVTPTGGEKETASFAVTGSRITVGESDNTYTLAWDGTATESDYTVEENIGRLKVTASTMELKVVSADGEWTYDGDAHTNKTYTVSFGDEKLEGVEGQVEFELSTGDVVTITPDEDATITHVAETTVDNAFSYTVENSDQYANTTKEEGKLTITPATLTIVTMGGEKEYDGKPLTAEGSISGFVTPDGGEQETATFTVTGSQTEVGESDNSYTLVWDGTAVESDYTLDKTIGKLKVTASTKELKVVSKDYEWTYDGNAHTYQTYKVSFGDEAIEGTEGQTEFTLSTGDTVTITPDEDATITHVAESDVTNAFSYTLENSNQYASKSKEEGKLTINPATLTIETGSARREYNGQPLTKEGSISGFVTPTGGEQETATFTVTGTITEVGGPIENSYTLVWDGTATESDYTVSENLGTLEITANPNPVVIESSTKSWEYDGDTHTDEVYTVTYGGEEVAADEGSDGKVFTLPTRDTITITATAEGVKDYNAEYNENNTYIYVLTHASNYSSVTANVGTLSIDRWAVQIIANYAEKTYDGSPLTEPGFRAGALGRHDDHTFTVVMTEDSTITNIGEQENVIATVDGVAVIPNDENEVGNYLVTLINGTLTVHPKQVTITAKDAEKTYDSRALTQSEFTATDLEEGDDHTFTVVMTEDSTITNIGTQANVIATVDGVAVTTGVETEVGNYLVTTVDGELKVNPKQVTILAKGAEKTYDGQPLTQPDFELYRPLDPTDHHTFTVVMTEDSTITNVGSKENKIATVDGVEVEAGEEIAVGNYLVLTQWGILNVYPKAVTITAKDASKTYDGSELTQPGFTASALETGDNHSFAVVMTEDSTITNIGEQANVIATVDGVEVTTGEETEVGNYLVTTVDGKLTVNPKAVTITAKDAEKDYDGQPLTQPEFTASALEDGDDHSFTVVMTEDSTITTAGTQANVIATVDGVEVTTGEETAVGNYLVTTAEGELKINVNAAHILIVSDTKSWTYDGETHTAETYAVTYDGEALQPDGGGKVFTLPTGDTITITATTEGVKDYNAEYNENNTFDYVLTNEDNYSNVFTTTGTLRIDKRSVRLISEDGQKEYDGTPLTKPDVTVEGGGFVEGEATEIKATGSVTTVTEGEVTNTITFTEGENFNAENYDIDKDEGQLWILPSSKSLVITSGTYNWTYDGYTHTYEDYTVSYDGDDVEADEGSDGKVFTLSTGDKVTITPTAAGVKDYSSEYGQNNTYEYALTNAGSFSNVNTDIGTLSITKRVVLLTSETASKEYDGTPLTRPEVTVSYDGFVEGEVQDLKAIGTVTTVAEGEVNNTIEYNENPLTFKADNYSINKLEGKLKIEPRKVTITAKDASKTYNGSELTQPEFEVEGQADTDDHEFEVRMTDESRITNAGTQENVIDTVDNEPVMPGEEIAIGNYLVTTVNGLLTVNRKAVTITAEDAEKPYDGQPLTEDGFTATDLEEGDEHTFTVEMTEDSTITYMGMQANRIDKVDDVTVMTGEETEVGNYLVTVVDGNLEITPNTTRITILSADDDKVYDGTELHKAEYQVTYGDTVLQAAADGSFTLPTGDRLTITDTSVVKNVADTADGNNTYTYYLENEDQYLYVTADYGKLTINLKDAEVTAIASAKTFGDPDPDFTAEVNGTVEGEEDLIVYTVTRPGAGTDEDAGFYKAAIEAAGEAIQGNYSVTYNPADFTIAQAGTMTVVATPHESVYDGQEHVLPAAVSNIEDALIEYAITDPDGEIPDEQLDWTAERPAATDVTDWTVRVRATHKNYETVTETTTFKITPRPVKVTADNKTKVYGTQDPELTVKIEGNLPGDEIAYQIGRAAGEDVGEYAITPAGAEAQYNGNYVVSFEPGKLEITPAEITVTAEPKTKVYGDPDPELTAVVTGLENVPADNTTANGAAAFEPEYKLSRADGEDVGTYVITPAGEEIQGNYHVTYVTDNLTITKAKATVTAEDKTKIYGEADPALTAKVDGLKNGDTADVIRYELTRAAGENAGEYVITAAGDAAQGNYDVEYVNGKLTITPYAQEVVVRITGEKKSVVYDGKQQSATGYQTEIGNELYKEADFSFTGEAAVRATDVKAGTNKVYVMGLTAAQFTNNNQNFTNVTFDVTDGGLEITPAPVTVKAEDKTKAQGAADPELTATVTGLIGDDTVTYTITRAPGETVGTYVITPAGDAEQGNYTVTYVTGNLLITLRGTILIVAEDHEKIYDGEAVTEAELKSFIKVTMPSGFSADDYDFEYRLAGGKTVKDVGSYTIITGVVIKDAQGNVVAEYGSMDAAEAKTAAVMLKDAAGLFAGAVGIAPMTAYADENSGFELEVTPGTYTITPREVTVTADNAEKRIGLKDPAFTATVTNAVKGEEDLIKYTIARKGTSDRIGTLAGEIVVTGDRNQGNYIVNFEPGDLTINRRSSGGGGSDDPSGDDPTPGPNPYENEFGPGPAPETGVLGAVRDAVSSFLGGDDQGVLGAERGVLGAARTGDESGLLLHTLLMMLSAASMSGMAIFRRRKEDEEE